MDDTQDEVAQRVSALVDGQLSDEEFARAIADLHSDLLARSQWDTYHVVGDAMRSSSGAVQLHDDDFVQRLKYRIVNDALKDEATDQDKTWAGRQCDVNLPSANDNSWRLMAGFVSAAACVLVAWLGLTWTSSPGPGSGQQLAKQEAVVSTLAALTSQTASTGLQLDSVIALKKPGESTLMIRDPRLDALLAAHRQFGGATALQMPSGFLRNATFEDVGP
jgi:sigma-E factor negative regulatory protein RseA